MFPSTFDPRVGVKPWQMRWSSSGQNSKHSTTIFCPPPLCSYPSFLTLSLLSLWLFHHLERVRESSPRTQTCFYCICCGNLNAHTLQIKNYGTGLNSIPPTSALFREGGKTKEYDLRGEALLKIWILHPCTLKAHCVCLESLSAVSRMRNVAVWFFTHAAGSSISGNISHSASLTPSALLQYPHIFFHPFTSSPALRSSLPPSSLAFSLLSDRSRSLYLHPLFSLIFWHAIPQNATTCVFRGGWKGAIGIPLREAV